jgi:sulfatase modifying factor 1
MVWIPGGTFLMGSNYFYAEESPAHFVTVGSFLMDITAVTNAEFARFVAASGYVTLAERQAERGSLVFQMATWHSMLGAYWRHPRGRGTSIDTLAHHPVVQVAFEDAQAYAAWAGKELPTEAEWEYAARGGLHAAVYAWGDQFLPEGRHMANTWQGDFPWQNLVEDGFETTAPVKSFPPNGYGLFEMTGNVWEWTTGDYSSGQKVLKGGSYLCSPNYCRRYRPAARHPQSPDTAACHVGFRCIVRGQRREDRRA